MPFALGWRCTACVGVCPEDVFFGCISACARARSLSFRYAHTGFMISAQGIVAMSRLDGIVTLTFPSTASVICIITTTISLTTTISISTTTTSTTIATASTTVTSSAMMTNIGTAPNTITATTRVIICSWYYSPCHY